MKIKLHKQHEEAAIENKGGVEQELRKMGILLPVLDPVSALKTSFELPADISKLPSGAISKLMGVCTVQQAFVLPQIALRSIELQRKSRLVLRGRAQIVANCSSANKFKADAEATNDKALQSLEDSYDALAGTISTLESVAETLKIKVSVLSRELSRRQSEVGLAGRLGA